jgi:hypothetical protein
MDITNNNNIKNNNNSFEYFIYFHVYSAAQRPTLKWRGTKDNNNINSSKYVC